ncbi:MAG: carboxypeptidase-like regulatory domain-containing protein [Bacteroidota bacterium]
MYSYRIITQFLFSILSFPLFAQFEISGKIQSSDNELLPGATIQLLGTNKGFFTNSEGYYTISGLKSGIYFLEVSYVGYETRKVSVEIINTNIELDIQVSQVPSQLNEIMVTANRRLEDVQKTASSVSVIQSKQVEQPQIKELNDLNSIASNFRVYDDDGDGSFTLFASRGISTINTSPIVGLYLDDVPYFNTFAFPH